MEYAICVVTILFDAHGKMSVAVETRRFLQDRAEHIEVMGEEIPGAVCFVELRKCSDVMKKRSVAVLLSQHETARLLAAAQKELTHLIP